MPVETARKSDRHPGDKLRELLAYNLRIVRAYLLKEDFQRFWAYSSPAWAGKFLDAWYKNDALQTQPDEEDRQNVAGSSSSFAQLVSRKR